MFSICTKISRLTLSNEIRQNLIIPSSTSLNLGSDFLSSRIISALTSSVHTSALLAAHHSKNRDVKVDFQFKRERPIGPHKAKTKNLIDFRATKEIDYRKKVFYPADGLYTIRKLKMHKMGGRHPVTGRKVVEGIGGGSKRRFRWIDWHRLPADWPRDGSVMQERVLGIFYDPNQDAQIALTCWEDKMRWQVATNKIKIGDLISTHTVIPTNPIRPEEGDSHPLGALPVGTVVCQVEMWPGEGAYFAKKAEENCKILRKVEDRVVIKAWNRLEFAVPETAQCVVGTNSIHPLRKMIIGSPNRNRWLGNRPRSGLWKRKTGRAGRKIKKLPPTIKTTPYAEYMKDAGTPNHKGVKSPKVLLHIPGEGSKGRIRAGKRKTMEGW